MRCRPLNIGELFVKIALVCAVAMVQPIASSPAADEKPAAGDAGTKDDSANSDAPADKPAEGQAADNNRTNPADPTAPLKRLVPGYDVWIDRKNKHVVIDAEVCLTRGLLEMFACLKGSKEHESVVSANTKAYVVHAALLALGAKSGSPAKWDPKYVPATGTQIDIMVYWTDEKGRLKKAKAQDWVRDIKSQQPLAFPWVFAGSAFHRNDMTRENHYLADASGDFICVSNFPSAMLDLPIESSQTNAELAFEAFTENIPPRGTKVQLVLMPQLEMKAKENLNRGDAESRRGE